MLARVGVTLKVDARSKTQFFPKIERRDTSLYLHGWGSSGPDPQVAYDLLLHSRDAQRGGSNHGGIADAELDRLIEAAATEMDPARRQGLLRDIQQRVADQNLVLPLHRQQLQWAMRPNVRAAPIPSGLMPADRIRVE